MPLSRRSLVGAALAAIAISAVAVAPSTGAPEQARKTVNVTVADDFYAPDEVKIKKDSKVKWNWEDFNLDTHNVKLTGEHPNGVKVKDFTSADGSIGIKFARKFKKPGKYGFVCTFHKSVMRMTVQVKR